MAEANAEPTDEQYTQAARLLWAEEGELEIDDNPRVARGDDPGAYVQAWVWVPLEDAQKAEAAP